MEEHPRSGTGCKIRYTVLLIHQRAAVQRKRGRVGLSGDDVLLEGAYAVPR